MAIYYHGSSVKFKSFDLSHALEGDGKVKFGYGVYLTSRYERAAHYAFNKKRPENKDYYVYTVEGPDKTEDNCLWQSPSCPVPESIVSRVKEKLGEDIPVEAIAEGKYFRKYVANRLAGVQGPIKKMIDSAPYIGEIALANLLDSIGVDMMAQPFIWKPPFDNIDLAVVNEKKVKILKIEKIELDSKKHLVPGSETLVELE